MFFWIKYGFFPSVCLTHFISEEYGRRRSDVPRPCLDFNQLTADDLDCPICLDMVKEPVRLRCNHLMCRECFEKLLEVSSRKCPKCRRWIGGTRRIISSWVDKELWEFIQLKFIETKDSVLEQIRSDRRLALALRRRERRESVSSAYNLRSAANRLNSSVSTTSSLTSEET